MNMHFFRVCLAFLCSAALTPLLSGQGRLVFPQFVNGEAGGVLNRSRIILRNNCGLPDSGVIRFRNSGGAPVQVPFGGSRTSEIPYDIDPWGARDLETDGTGPLVNGSAEVSSNLGSESCLDGSIAYDVLGSRVSTASSRLNRLHRTFASRTATENAGVAVYNPNQNASVQLEALLLDATGSVRAERILELNPRNQIAAFIDDEALFSDFFATHAGDFSGTVSFNTIFAGSGFPRVAVVGLIQDAVDNRLTAVETSQNAYTRFRIANLATPRTNLRLSASEIVFDIPVRVDFEDSTGTASSEELTVVFEVGDAFFGSVPSPDSPGEPGFRRITPPAGSVPAENGKLDFFLHRVVAPELLQTGVVRPLAVPIRVSMSNSMDQPSNEVSAYVLVDAGGVIRGLDGATHVAVSPDGVHVYVASVTDDSVAVFERDPNNGTLRFVVAVSDSDPLVEGLNGVNFVNLSPDGGLLYAVSSSGNSVAVFDRNAETGELTFLDASRDGQNGADHLRQASSLAVSPNGGTVYVTASRDNALSLFTANPRTGRLTPVTEFIDNVAGVDGLQGAQFVALSPDGRNAYVASSGEDAIAAFGPVGEQPFGFLEAFRDGQNAGNSVVDGLAGATSLAVSPDGARVYVAAESDDALAVFQRDPETGRLTFLTSLFDGVGGIDGLAGAESVAVSPDSRHVYVASSGDDAVAVFERSQPAGTLRFVGALRDGVGGVDGLRDASSVAISPDGGHVYVTGSGDDGIAVFQRDSATGFLLFVEARLESQGAIGISSSGSPF